MRIFVSYSHVDAKSGGRDRPRSHLLKFLSDLEGELRERTGKDIPVLFRDHADIRLGEGWSERLGKELQECSLLLAICSPSYLVSNGCYKEFKALLERREAAQRDLAGGQLGPTGVFPIIWTKPHDSGFPRSISALQLKTESLPAQYNERGLRDICTLYRYRDVRQETLQALATGILDALKDPLPAAERLFEWNADHGSWPPPGSTETAESTNARRSARPRVRLTILAGTEKEMINARSFVSYYGCANRDWNPFLTDPIEVEVHRAAAEHRLATDTLDLDRNIRQHIDNSLARSEVVLVLVDPWTLRLSRYQTISDTIDKVAFPNGCLLVVRNGTDPETLKHEIALQDALSVSFPRKLSERSNNYVFRGIDDLERFKEYLGDQLVRALQIVLRRAPNFRRAEGFQLSDGSGLDLSRRPEVQGPVFEP